jgi:hypothetical protein
MKRIIASLLLVIMTLSFTGCTFDPLSLFGINSSSYEKQDKRQDKAEKQKAKEDKEKDSGNKQKNPTKKSKQ